MTRKDYGVIATALAQAGSEAKTKGMADGVTLCIEHISHALAVDNPKFLSGKFRAFITKEYMKIARS